jgi:thymidylate kinase
MPGAGKTTTARLLEKRGHQVVGEYLSERPGVNEDEAHQRNWIAKASVTSAALAQGHVFCDRDFLTSLAFAWSVADRELIARRSSWALRHLAAGQLVVGDAYLVLDVAPSVSLARRAGQLVVGHPWSRLVELERLRRFYLSPLEALSGIDVELAAAFAGARWCDVSGDKTTPEAVVTSALGLAEELGGWRR